MKSSRLDVLNRGIKEVLDADLRALGFRYDGASRTFRRSVGEFVQIINFQAGQRSLEGRFTVNLGVFHPEYHDNGRDPGAKPLEYHCLVEFRSRIGGLIDSPILRFLGLPMPSDKWWPFSPDASQVRRELDRVKPLVLGKAVPWLERQCDVEAMRRALEERRRRLERRAS